MAHRSEQTVAPINVPAQENVDWGELAGLDALKGAGGWETHGKTVDRESWLVSSKEQQQAGPSSLRSSG
jgi:hypothetical protein